MIVFFSEAVMMVIKFFIVQEERIRFSFFVFLYEVSKDTFVANKKCVRRMLREIVVKSKKLIYRGVILFFCFKDCAW